MEKLKLYSFETAEMHLTQATIIPSIYYVEVTGKTGSLNPVIQLENIGKVEDGYLVVEVLGENRAATGTVAYKRSIDVTQQKDTVGVIVIGADKKEVKLPWQDVKLLSTKATTGLFSLPLVSESKLLGAPILHLNLGVDSVNDTVSGMATVTQSLEKPVVLSSHVTGKLIYESVMKPGVSKIRIDLSGYPEIHLPKGGGVGPVIPKNFSAMILFDENWSNGTVQYQYMTSTGWVKENQSIEIVK